MYLNLKDRYLPRLVNKLRYFSFFYIHDYIIKMFRKKMPHSQSGKTLETSKGKEYFMSKKVLSET